MQTLQIQIWRVDRNDIGEFYFSPDLLAHLLYCYAFGVPSHRSLVGKKHYIGILSDPSREPNIKGMEGIKSDRPEFINRVFRQLVDDIKNDIDPIPKLRQAFQHLNGRQVQVEQLAISLVLRKNQKSRRLSQICKRKFWAATWVT